MKNLTRAIRMALTYKYSLVGSIVCSVLVAVLWGANITAVYPFVEVVFQGKSLSEWIDEEIAGSVKKINEFDTKVAELNARLATSRQREADQREIDVLRSRVDSLRSKLKRQQRSRVWIQEYAPASPFRTLGLIVAFLLAGTLLKCLFRIASLVLVSRVGGRTTVDLRNALFRSLLSDRAKLPSGVGDMAGRIGGDVGAIGAAIQTLFGRSVQEPLKMVACLVGAAAVNWRLLLFSLLTCPVGSFLLLSLARSIRRASLRAFDQKCLLLSRMLQTFQGLHVVKAYNMESHERRRFWQHTLRVYREELKITFYGGLVRANNEMLGIGMICLSAMAGGYLVMNARTDLLGIPLAANPMDFGQIMLFYAFLIGCTDPLRKIADVYGTVQCGVAAADRIMPWIDAADKNVPAIAEQPLKSARRDIVFENVSFHYVPHKPVLRNLSFRIPFGETLAIVGPNGCGKSTLVNLLLRFLQPVEGRILLGDTDLRTYRLKDFRRCVSLVTQRPILFSDTVLNNIRYGSKAATKDQVVRAAQQAHAHEFIVDRLENGYETHCGEFGRRLSGGQQQRLTLARAIIRNPDLLIMDEASSQIDPRSEELVRQSLKEFVHGRTTIMITHRLSTLELADRILVMDAGQIVDIGTHDELLGRCPTYQGLHQTKLRKSA